MADTPKKDAAPPAADTKKKGPSPIGLILPAILAAAGAFGGAKLGGGTAHAAPAHEEAAAAEPPGPTLALDPFIVTMADASGKTHAIKMTLALELKHSSKEEEFKSFVPRIRDAALGCLRAKSFEDASNSAKIEDLRNEIKERIAKLGATSVEQILITDFVAQ